MDRVPTTDEMDGYFTEEDLRDKNKLYVQCFDCLKWTLFEKAGNEVSKILHDVTCSHCGKHNFDSTSVKSKRTYNSFTDNKRRPKKTVKKA